MEGRSVLRTKKNPPFQRAFLGLAMVGVGRIELPTPAMSTQIIRRFTAKSGHFARLAARTRPEQTRIFGQIHRSDTGLAVLA
jgi:hypothetical protein